MSETENKNKIKIKTNQNLAIDWRLKEIPRKMARMMCRLRQGLGQSCHLQPSLADQRNHAAAQTRMMDVSLPTPSRLKILSSYSSSTCFFHSHHLTASRASSPADISISLGNTARWLSPPAISGRVLIAQLYCDNDAQDYTRLGLLTDGKSSINISLKSSYPKLLNWISKFGFVFRGIINIIFFFFWILIIEYIATSVRLYPCMLGDCDAHFHSYLQCPEMEWNKIDKHLWRALLFFITGQHKKHSILRKKKRKEKLRKNSQSIFLSFILRFDSMNQPISLKLQSLVLHGRIALHSQWCCSRIEWTDNLGKLQNRRAMCDYIQSTGRHSDHNSLLQLPFLLAIGLRISLFWTLIKKRKITEGLTHFLEVMVFVNQELLCISVWQMGFSWAEFQLLSRAKNVVENILLGTKKNGRWETVFDMHYVLTNAPLYIEIMCQLVIQVDSLPGIQLLFCLSRKKESKKPINFLPSPSAHDIDSKKGTVPPALESLNLKESGSNHMFPAFTSFFLAVKNLEVPLPDFMMAWRNFLRIFASKFRKENLDWKEGCVEKLGVDGSLYATNQVKSMHFFVSVDRCFWTSISGGKSRFHAGFFLLIQSGNRENSCKENNKWDRVTSLFKTCRGEWQEHWSRATVLLFMCHSKAKRLFLVPFYIEEVLRGAERELCNVSKESLGFSFTRILEFSSSVMGAIKFFTIFIVLIKIKSIRLNNHVQYYQLTRKFQYDRIVATWGISGTVILPLWLTVGNWGHRVDGFSMVREGAVVDVQCHNPMDVGKFPEIEFELEYVGLPEGLQQIFKFFKAGKAAVTTKENQPKILDGIWLVEAQENKFMKMVQSKIKRYRISVSCGLMFNGLDHNMDKDWIEWPMLCLKEDTQNGGMGLNGLCFDHLRVLSERVLVNSLKYLASNSKDGILSFHWFKFCVSKIDCLVICCQSRNVYMYRTCMCQQGKLCLKGCFIQNIHNLHDQPPRKAKKIQLSKDWYLNTGAGVEEADGKVFFNEALVAHINQVEVMNCMMMKLKKKSGQRSIPIIKLNLMTPPMVSAMSPIHHNRTTAPMYPIWRIFLLKITPPQPQQVAFSTPGTCHNPQQSFQAQSNPSILDDGPTTCHPFPSQCADIKRNTWIPKGTKLQVKFYCGQGPHEMGEGKIQQAFKFEKEDLRFKEEMNIWWENNKMSLSITGYFPTVVCVSYLDARDKNCFYFEFWNVIIIFKGFFRNFYNKKKRALESQYLGDRGVFGKLGPVEQGFLRIISIRQWKGLGYIIIPAESMPHLDKLIRLDTGWSNWWQQQITIRLTGIQCIEKQKEIVNSPSLKQTSALIPIGIILSSMIVMIYHNIVAYEPLTSSYFLFILHRYKQSPHWFSSFFFQAMILSQSGDFSKGLCPPLNLIHPQD
ncbi:hypothetical protein VP01_907g2 [Puccinia sorghi]|uniref:Uncharacterized protein n=1 Tax=Puccinia sorghi TaxID=27349 RepID=A0A0L6U7M7_9BASI|nr:hypothetical protein VP01_907g2 [Puccinia sorghi]